MIAQLIQDQIGNFGNWGVAGALSLVLLAGTGDPAAGCVQRDGRAAGVRAMTGDGMAGVARGARRALPAGRALSAGAAGDRGDHLVQLGAVPAVSAAGLLAALVCRTCSAIRAWTSALAVSVEMLVPAALLATVLGTAAAYALVRGNIPGAAVIQALPDAADRGAGHHHGGGAVRRVSRPRPERDAAGLVIGHTVLTLPYVVATVSSALRSAGPAAGGGGGDAGRAAVDRVPPGHAAAARAGDAVGAAVRDGGVVRRADRLAVRQHGAGAAGAGADVVEPARRFRPDDRGDRVAVLPVRAARAAGGSDLCPAAGTARRDVAGSGAARAAQAVWRRRSRSSCSTCSCGRTSS